jgi:pyruvate/2-oxoglutarate dehydrogenase complex dihydrolipoamide dehydrogenase (E3) component
LIAIGAGAGGLISSKQSARRGARSALIEYHLAGGDCLNVGCVPSKALIRCARNVKECRASAELGVRIAGGAAAVSVDFGAVMTRMRRLRAHIAPVDALETSCGLGVDVYQGKAKMVAKDAVEVNGQVLRFKNLVIATGGKPTVPSIPGLKEVPYHTNASIFNLTELPNKMVVIGGGPIGLELAQAFALFGTEVIVTLRGDRLLPKEDPDAAAIVLEALKHDGVKFMFGVTYEEVKSSNVGDIEVFVSANDAPNTLSCDVLLVATGRTPNVEGLGLELGGVAYTKSDGVLVGSSLRSSSNPKVWAVGDVCTKFQFTHVSASMASIVVENSLFGGSRVFDDNLLPWCTFTEPEVAHTGLYESDCLARGIQIDTFKTDLAHCDRSILESATRGFVKVHVKKGTDIIVGATIVAPCAGEMISELTVAMQSKVGLGALGRIVHPYPTVADAICGCGVSYNRTVWKTVKSEEANATNTRKNMITIAAYAAAAAAAAAVSIALFQKFRRS